MITPHVDNRCVWTLHTQSPLLQAVKIYMPCAYTPEESQIDVAENDDGTIDCLWGLEWLPNGRLKVSAVGFTHEGKTIVKNIRQLEGMAKAEFDAKFYKEKAMLDESESLIRGIYEQLKDLEHDIGLVDAYTQDSDRSADEDYYLCESAQAVVAALNKIKDAVESCVDEMEEAHDNSKGFFIVAEKQVVNDTDDYYITRVMCGYTADDIKKDYCREIDKWEREDDRYDGGDHRYCFRVLGQKYDTEEEAQKAARALSEDDIGALFQTAAQPEAAQ